MNGFSLQAYLEDLKAICAIDSGHAHADGTQAVADFFEQRYRALGLQTKRLHYQDNDFAPVLLVSNRDLENIDVLMVAHMDTVFPVGTAAQWPLTVDEQGIGHAPGIVDCKGGCLMIYYLVRYLLEKGLCNFSFCVALNSDEERGSAYSRPYFEELAQKTKYCFVFEPGRANCEFVACRKGGSNYILRCHGIAAHSGVDPEKGASAILELSRWVNELYKLTDYEKGTTLNVGRFQGGSDGGAVPDYAECTLSFRNLLPEAKKDLEQLLDRMQKTPFDPRCRIEVECKSVRPAMFPHEATQALLEQLKKAGENVGQTVTWLTTGGGSDGNFIAHYGVATLDGCGPCGAALHTKEEYLLTASVEQRLDLMLQLLRQLFG